MGTTSPEGRYSVPFFCQAGKETRAKIALSNGFSIFRLFNLHLLLSDSFISRKDAKRRKAQIGPYDSVPTSPLFMDKIN